MKTLRLAAAALVVLAIGSAAHVARGEDTTSAAGQYVMVDKSPFTPEETAHANALIKGCEDTVVDEMMRAHPDITDPSTLSEAQKNTLFDEMRGRRSLCVHRHAVVDSALKHRYRLMPTAPAQQPAAPQPPPAPDTHPHDTRIEPAQPV